MTGEVREGVRGCVNGRGKILEGRGEGNSLIHGEGWWAMMGKVDGGSGTKVEEVGREVHGGGRMAAQRSGGSGNVGMSARGNK